MGFLNIEGIANPDITGDVKNVTNNVIETRHNISQLTNDPNKNTDLVKKLGQSNNIMLDSVGNILSKTYDIQSSATEQAKNASVYLNRSNDYLGELNEKSNNEINGLKIQKDNKKRIIEMQRNRLFKYQYIKESLLYLIAVILICGVILYIEQLFSKIKPFSSVLLIVVGVVSSMFFIFRGINYFSRSKFNFRQYDINIGGEKYKKNVYEYDRDQIQNMGDSAINQVELGIQSGIDNLDSGLQSMKSDDE